MIACDFDGYTEENEPTEIYTSSTAGGSFEVLRLAAPKQVKANLLRRLSSYAAFMLRAAYQGAKLEKPDVIIGSIQPLFTGIGALLIAKIKHVPLVLEVRDLWPDALEVKGAVTGWKAAPLHWLANLLYAKADRLVSSTPGIKTELVKKGIPDTQIDVFPNGFLPAMADVPADTRQNVRSKYGWGDDFIALYAGTHAEVTAIDVLVKAAAELSGHNIRLVCFGSGPTKAPCMELAEQLSTTNIEFYDPVPLSHVAELIEACDVTLMALFKSPLIHIYFQNKFMTYLGMGRPIFAAMEGDQAELIEKLGCGRVVDTFDHQALATELRKADDNPAEIAQMGHRGREFVYEHLLLTQVLDRYAKVVEATAERNVANLPVWGPLTASDSADHSLHAMKSG